jgi:hypothetical protein
VNVVSEDPRERIEGLDEDGFAAAAVFACVHCGTRQPFSNPTLTDRHIQASSGREVFAALSAAQREPFERVIGRQVKGLFDRFVSDFNCTGCGAPTVIMWRWEEGQDDVPRYQPLAVIECATWP